MSAERRHLPESFPPMIETRRDSGMRPKALAPGFVDVDTGQWRRSRVPSLGLRALLWIGLGVVLVAACWAALSGCASASPLPARGTPAPDASVTVSHDAWWITGDRRAP